MLHEFVVKLSHCWRVAGTVSHSAMHSNGKSHAPAEVDSTPVLTRLTASSACRQPAQQHLDSLFGRGHIGKSHHAAQSSKANTSVCSHCAVGVYLPAVCVEQLSSASAAGRCSQRPYRHCASVTCAWHAISQLSILTMLMLCHCLYMCHSYHSYMVCH